MMTNLHESVCVKHWQLLAMLGMSGFATGNILAKLTSALGF
jgi:hypothetical protein